MKDRTSFIFQDSHFQEYEHFLFEGMLGSVMGHSITLTHAVVQCLHHLSYLIGQWLNWQIHCHWEHFTVLYVTQLSKYCLFAKLQICHFALHHPSLIRFCIAILTFPWCTVWFYDEKLLLPKWVSPVLLQDDARKYAAVLICTKHIWHWCLERLIMRRADQRTCSCYTFKV